MASHNRKQASVDFCNQVQISDAFFSEIFEKYRDEMIIRVNPIPPVTLIFLGGTTVISGFGKIYLFCCFLKNAYSASITTPVIVALFADAEASTLSSSLQESGN